MEETHGVRVRVRVCAMCCAVCARGVVCVTMANEKEQQKKRTRDLMMKLGV